MGSLPPSETPRSIVVNVLVEDSLPLHPPFLTFLTKAETLVALTERLASARVLPSHVFSVSEWQRDPDAMLHAILANPSLTGPLIVRSSAAAEDGSTSSLAGRFTSCRAEAERDALARAIETVVTSYGDTTSSKDQVLIQPFLGQTQCSGVAFNRDPKTGSFYDVIDYTFESDTELVTSGKSGLLRAYRSAHWARGEVHPAPLGQVIALLTELEGLFGEIPLDCEFAVADGQLFLFQVRPLTCAAHPTLTPTQHARVGQQVHLAIETLLKPKPDVLGERTILGVMPDWNPAEMIGIRPRPLALSLYRFLVTDHIWAQSRRKYGYRDTRNVPLMISVHGLPYIDVRASFNSLLPAKLDVAPATRLVDACLARLEANPQLHDKVEFDVMPTCHSFRLAERLEQLELSSGDTSEISAALHDLTCGFLRGRGKRQFDIDSGKIRQLTALQKVAVEANQDVPTQLHRLLSDCRRLGTGAFAGLARAAFVGTEFLRSAVMREFVEQAESDALMGSLDTPMASLVLDAHRISREEFVSRYGHLRPGTYDIRVPTYADNLDAYIGVPPSGQEVARSLVLSTTSRTRLARALEAERIPTGVEGFLSFIRETITTREHAKFVFTRSGRVHWT